MATTTKTWREASPIAAEIISGKHDEELNYIAQACYEPTRRQAGGTDAVPPAIPQRPERFGALERKS